MRGSLFENLGGLLGRAVVDDAGVWVGVSGDSKGEGNRPPPVVRGRFARRPARTGLDQRLRFKLLANQPVIGF